MVFLHNLFRIAITDQDPNSRRIHTTELVYVLWKYTHADSVTVEYLEKDGTANFRTTAYSELFQRIERDGLPRVTIAEEAKLTDLKCDRRLVD